MSKRSLEQQKNVNSHPPGDPSQGSPPSAPAPPVPSTQKPSPRTRERFLAHLANTSIEWAGSSWAFLLALGTVIVWGISGPLFGFSDTWQLVINTGTTIVTFLMVFLIQRAQNKDSQAIHVKLDELIAAVHGASNQLIDA